MRRSWIGVVVVCLVVVGASAAPSAERDGGLELRRERVDPISKIVRIVKKVIGSLGDGLGGPKP